MNTQYAERNISSRILIWLSIVVSLVILSITILLVSTSSSIASASAQTPTLSSPIVTTQEYPVREVKYYCYGTTLNYSNFNMNTGTGGNYFIINSPRCVEGVK